MANKFEEKQKALAIEIAKVAKRIVPDLVDLTKGIEFKLTILDDGEGFGILVEVSDNPQVASIILPGMLKESSEEILPIEEESLRIEEGEKTRIQKALQKTNGDKRKAAELVGLSERTFFRKCKEYGLKK